MKTRLALTGVLLATLVPVPGAGQQMRGWATTTFRYMELRPLERIVIDPALLTVDDAGRTLFEGQPVRCIPGAECVQYRPAAVEAATVGTQDVGLTAWGLGVEGLSVTTLLRGRARFGGDFVWPRSEDELDVLLGYAQLARGPWRARLGRQQTLSGLGFTGYDGASVRVRALDYLTVEAYGGRSLARGLAEPRNEALRGVENFVIDRSAWLIGGALQGSFDGGTDVALRYQREIWSNRVGLISERASLDATTRVLDPVRVRASMDWDFAFGQVGKAELELHRPLPWQDLMVAVEARRYVPYFELSTIWGFFSPVAYHELLGRLAWSGATTTAWAEGGVRSYGDTHADILGEPLTDDGWRASAGAIQRIGSDWSAEGRWEIEWGVGAFLHAGDARLHYRPSDEIELTAHATTFQRIEEFRLGDGRVWGGGLGADIGLLDRVRLEGGVALYRHDDDDTVNDEIWSQTRIWTSLRVDFGEDPGRPRPRLRR